MVVYVIVDAQCASLQVVAVSFVGYLRDAEGGFPYILQKGLDKNGNALYNASMKCDEGK